MSDGIQRGPQGGQELIYTSGDGERGPGRWNRSSGIWKIGALIAVAAVCAFVAERAVTRAEVGTRQTMRAALNATGHGWVQLDVSGRKAHLHGAAPSESAADSAVVIARQTMCPTRAGSHRCASRISSDFDGPGRAWPDVRATIERGVLTLAGVVPDEGTRWAVVDRARGAVRLGKIRRVVDEMTLSGGGAPAGVDAAAALVGEVTALCESGGATLSKGVLSVRCQVSDALAAQLRKLVEAPMQSGYLGEVRLTVAADTFAQDGG